MADSKFVRKLFHLYWLIKRPATLGVRGLVTDETGRILLVRHTYVSGWYLPGGGVEVGETAGEALEKELMEEAMIALGETPKLISIHRNHHISKRDHVLFYRCGKWRFNGEFQPNREIAEIGFFSPDALPEGTTKATLRRLAETLGETPPSPEW